MLDLSSSKTLNPLPLPCPAAPPWNGWHGPLTCVYLRTFLPCLVQSERDPGNAALPDSIALVDGSVALAERCPSCAFWLCDMLKSHAALSTPNRQVGRGCLPASVFPLRAPCVRGVFLVAP